ncbi:MAG: glycosyltransferase family 1 protein [Plesiomonas sp.]
MDEMIRKVLFKKYQKLNKKENAHSAAFNGHCPRVIILHEGNSPTLAYFQNSISEQFGHAQIILKDSNDLSHLSIQQDDAIVVIRFISSFWQARIEQNIDKVSKIVYFIDDDLLDPAALQRLPKDYRKKILRRASAQHRWITLYCDEFWVSTPYLSEKYAHFDPKIIQPKPPVSLFEPVSTLRVAYHGSSSHKDEKIWLHDVISRVMERTKNITFEIFGEHDIYKLYRNIPRVTVLHPMSWDNYLVYTKTQRIDIGLAPLLDSDFNAARGHVKFYDFVRMGAVGIFSDSPPYQGVVKQNVNGILLDNDIEKWTATIESLACNHEKRSQLVENARRTVMSPLSTD